jgi:hypothetical protein
MASNEPISFMHPLLVREVQSYIKVDYFGTTRECG